MRKGWKIFLWTSALVPVVIAGALGVGIATLGMLKVKLWVLLLLLRMGGAEGIQVLPSEKRLTVERMKSTRGKWGRYELQGIRIDLDENQGGLRFHWSFSKVEIDFVSVELFEKNNVKNPSLMAAFFPYLRYGLPDLSLNRFKVEYIQFSLPKSGTWCFYGSEVREVELQFRRKHYAIRGAETECWCHPYEGAGPKDRVASELERVEKLGNLFISGLFFETPLEVDELQLSLHFTGGLKAELFRFGLIKPLNFQSRHLKVAKGFLSVENAVVSLGPLELLLRGEIEGKRALPCNFEVFYKEDFLEAIEVPEEKLLLRLFREHAGAPFEFKFTLPTFRFLRNYLARLPIVIDATELRARFFSRNLWELEGKITRAIPEESLEFRASFEKAAHGDWSMKGGVTSKVPLSLDLSKLKSLAYLKCQIALIPDLTLSYRGAPTKAPHWAVGGSVKLLNLFSEIGDAFKYTDSFHITPDEVIDNRHDLFKVLESPSGSSTFSKYIEGMDWKVENLAILFPEEGGEFCLEGLAVRFYGSLRLLAEKGKPLDLKGSIIGRKEEKVEERARGYTLPFFIENFKVFAPGALEATELEVTLKAENNFRGREQSIRAVKASGTPQLLNLSLQLKGQEEFLTFMQITPGKEQPFSQSLDHDGVHNRLWDLLLNLVLGKFAGLTHKVPLLGSLVRKVEVTVESALGLFIKNNSVSMLTLRPSKTGNSLLVQMFVIECFDWISLLAAYEINHEIELTRLAINSDNWLVAIYAHFSDSVYGSIEIFPKVLVNLNFQVAFS